MYIYTYMIVYNNYVLMSCDICHAAGGKWGDTHVVVDSHVVTGQNEQSTLTAVQNLILMCNAR